jgi:hypothetical protein
MVKIPKPAHNGMKAELGVCGGGGLIGTKMAVLISYVFTAILLLMKYVNTFNGRYLSKEAFFQTILLTNKYFKATNWT